jgi:hypothetical protein
MQRLADRIRAWQLAPFLFRRGAGGRYLSRWAAALHFRFGRASYTERERFDAIRISSRSTWDLLRSALFPMILAAVAVGAFGVVPVLYEDLANRWALPVLVRLPAPDGQTYNGLMGTVAQATAAILALFFTAVSVVASTAYAKITTEIRSLVAHDPPNRRYLRLLAHTAASAMGAVGLQAAGVPPSFVLGAYVLILAAICVLAFVPLGVRTFALFDPASLAHYPARLFSRALARATPSGHRWLDPPFQNHANTIASTQLRLLEDLTIFAIADTRPRNDTVVALARQVLHLAHFYALQKSSVPSDSLWFPKKAQFRRWEVADSSMTEIALHTGITPLPDAVPDHGFVESSVVGMTARSVQHLIDRRAFDDLATVLQVVNATATAYSQTFAPQEALKLVGPIRAAVVKHLAVTDSSAEPLKYLHVADLVCVSALAPILHTALSLAQRPVDQVVRLDTALLSLNARELYREAHPRRVLESAEDLLRRLQFEQTVEKTVKTERWYVRQIIALAYAAFVRDTIASIVTALEQEFILPASQLAAAKRPVWAAVWLQRSMEACSKAKDRIEGLQQFYEDLKQFQVAELQWKPSGGDAALAKVDTHRKTAVHLLATIIPDLTAVESADGLPDVVGPARAWIADELVSMMEHKEPSGFSELFTAYFSASLATQQHFLTLAQKSGEDNYVFVASNVTLDVMDVSGLAWLFSELDHTPFATAVSATWDLYLTRASDVAATVRAMYAAMELKLDGPLFSPSAMRRQEWGRRFAAALSDRGVDAERDFGPFSRGDRAVHPSPVIESIRVMYGHLMDDPHEYFGALYLMNRPDAEGVPPPHQVESCRSAIERARTRLEKSQHEPTDQSIGA